MTFAFALFKYFPFGGLQRDFLRIALECQKRGHEIRVYTTSWQGDQPEGFDIQFLKVNGSSNHGRMVSFQDQVHQALKELPADLLVGFNKMAGLDVYYAADTCFQEKAKTERSWVYRLTPRYRAFVNLEESVFLKGKKTSILALTEHQISSFQKIYKTETERFKLLTPGIERNKHTKNKNSIRENYRKRLNLKNDDLVLLLVGSSFKTKGLDRAIKTLAHMNATISQNATLLVCGTDDSKKYLKQAKNLGCDKHVKFLGGRKDIQQLMLAADLLIHPAYTESAGMVLLEAVAAGLPIVTTDICGYAPFVTKSGSGKVIRSPFKQAELDEVTSGMLVSDQKSYWQKNALSFAAEHDLYSQHSKAAEFLVSLATQEPK